MFLHRRLDGLRAYDKRVANVAAKFDGYLSCLYIVSAALWP